MAEFIRDGNDVIAAGHIEDGGSDADDFEGDVEVVDAILDGVGDFVFSANGRLDSAAGGEDVGVKPPAVHRDADWQGKRSKSGFVRFFEDASEMAKGIEIGDGEFGDAISGDVGSAKHGVAVEACSAAGVEIVQGLESFNRVVIVGIKHKEGILPGERFSGGDGVGGAERFFLDGEVDGEARGRNFAVVVADDVMFRADDEAGAGDTGVGAGGKGVVEKGASNGNHGFDAGVGDGGLFGGEGGVDIGFTHAGAYAAGEDDDFFGLRHSLNHSRESEHRDAETQRRETQRGEKLKMKFRSDLKRFRIFFVKARVGNPCDG